MLHILPAEIALQTVSYLPLQDLYSAILVSRDWNTLVAVNEPAVYRDAALLHRFLEQDQLRADSTSTNPKFAHVHWKTYCRRQLEIERGWRGKAPSVVRELSATGSAVHRIKVDHEQGFVITTCQTGGLFVSDIQDNRILWSLPSSHVVRYAHCEYDRGFIVFNRIDNCKEVWRQTIDVNDDELPQTSPPDTQMLEASAQAAKTYPSTDDNRGHFIPWALLRMPEITRAFRFSYPTFLAIASNNAYLWDLPRAELVSVVRDIQRLQNDTRLGNINYAEVNDRFVFICGAVGLRIFAREDGALVYHLSTKELAAASWDVLPQARGVPESALQPQMLLQASHSYSFPGEFMACHVSESGDDLAALTTIGRLVIIPGFRRLFSGSNPAHHRDIALILNFISIHVEGEISYYLAVGNRNGKFAMATRKGLFVISPDFGFSRLTADRPPHPGVTVCRLSKFDNERFLSFLSCLQLTHSGMYFNYKPSQRDGRNLRERTLAVQAQLTALMPTPAPAPVPAPAQQPPALAQPVPAHNEDHIADADGVQGGFLGHMPHQLEDPLDPWDELEMEMENEDEGIEDDMADDEDDEDDVELVLENWFHPVGMSTVYGVTF